jgi:hypothetical protein
MVIKTKIVTAVTMVTEVEIRKRMYNKISKLTMYKGTPHASCKDFGGVIGRLNQLVLTSRSTLIPIVFVATLTIYLYIYLCDMHRLKISIC